jgi:hypothetical protein
VARFQGRVIIVNGLFSSAQCGRHDARIAASVNYRDNEERLFIRCVGDQVIADDMKTQWP